MGRSSIAAAAAASAFVFSSTATVATAAPERAAKRHERALSLVVVTRKALVLRSTVPVGALVARVRAQGCGAGGARMTISLNGRRLVRTVVGRRSRRLRAGHQLDAGRHRVVVQVQGRSRCRVALSGIALEPAPVAPLPVDPTVVAPRAVPIGAALEKRADNWWDETYPQAFLGHFDGLTPENMMKPDVTWPEPERYDFERADELVEFAVSNGRSVHGHTLFWHRQIPKWLTARQWDPADLAPRAQAYVEQVVGRYKGRVREWDVVNEPLADDGSGLRESFWRQNLGPSYVEQALRWAHAADPEAKLYINEYDIEKPGPKLDALERLVRDLKSRGVPLHGIGFQFHIDYDGPFADPHAVYATLKRVADLGVEVQITEMDVAIDPPAAGVAEALEAQAARYQAVAQACNALPACTRFTTWGVTDKYSWRGSGTAPLLLNTKYQEKNAWHVVRSAFALTR